MIVNMNVLTSDGTIKKQLYDFMICKSIGSGTVHGKMLQESIIQNNLDQVKSMV